MRYLISFRSTALHQSRNATNGLKVLRESLPGQYKSRVEAVMRSLPGTTSFRFARPPRHPWLEVPGTRPESLCRLSARAWRRGQMGGALRLPNFRSWRGLPVPRPTQFQSVWLLPLATHPHRLRSVFNPVFLPARRLRIFFWPTSADTSFLVPGWYPTPMTLPRPNRDAVVLSVLVVAVLT